MIKFSHFSDKDDQLTKGSANKAAPLIFGQWSGCNKFISVGSVNQSQSVS
jgi:hypothetical protein